MALKQSHHVLEHVLKLAIYAVQTSLPFLGRVLCDNKTVAIHLEGFLHIKVLYLIFMTALQSRYYYLPVLQMEKLKQNLPITTHLMSGKTWICIQTV